MFFESLKFQFRDQICAGISNPGRYLSVSRHLCPASGFHQLLLFPRAFRYEYSLVGCSIRILPELGYANRRQCRNNGVITLGFCGKFGSAAGHPAGPTKPDNRQGDGSSCGDVHCWFDYFGSHGLFLSDASAVHDAAQQWTADDLTADRPFGSIEIGRAGNSQRDFQAFFDNLSDQQRAEISSRCAVIGSDGRFAQWVRDMCVKVHATQTST